MALNIVLTGGPSAGKTQISRELKEIYAKHLLVCPEAANMLFRGGFPRIDSPEGLQARQYAIFHLQRSLESLARQSPEDPKYILYDRGLLDGLCYWPKEAPDFFEIIKTETQEVYQSYDLIIQLGVPSAKDYHNHTYRTEDHQTSLIMEKQLKGIWSSHPNYHFIEYNADWATKRQKVIDLIQQKSK